MDITTLHKLTYLNETKGLLKDSLNQFEAGITEETTFRNYVSKINDIYNNWEKVTGTGSILNLSPTRKGRLGIVPYGDTYQFSATGKNKLAFPYTESTLTRDGITYTINNDGSISISGTATATSYINLYANQTTNLLTKGQQYTFSISPSNNSLNLTFLERYNNAWNDNGYGKNAITFTVSQNSEGQLIRIIVGNGETINTTIFPQIETGSSATSYEPYVGGTASPNPDYPQEIKSVTGLQKVSVGGKNFLDLTKYPYSVEQSTFNGGTISIDNGVITVDGTNSTGFVTARSLEVASGNRDTIPAGTYYFGVRTNGYFINNGVKTFKQTNIGANILDYPYEIVQWFVPASPGNITTTNLQIEKGSTASTYQAYTKQEYEVNLKTNKLYSEDYITGTPDNWSIYRVNGEVVLDGTENWTNAGLITNIRRYSMPLSNTKLNDASNTNKYCNYFKYIFDYNLDEPHFYINPNGLLYLFTPITDMTQFRNWLGTNTPKVVYKLETPTTEPITNTELIEQLNDLYNAKSYDGQTNISVEGDLPMILDVSALMKGGN